MTTYEYNSRLPFSVCVLIFEYNDVLTRRGISRFFLQATTLEFTKSYPKFTKYINLMSNSMFLKVTASSIRHIMKRLKDEEKTLLMRNNSHLIDRQIDWLEKAKGKTFYAVGGAWRAISRIHMNLTDYPLLVAHHYEIPGKQALAFANTVALDNQGMLGKFHRGISKKRVETLLFAAKLLSRLIEISGVSNVIFSSYGLREGCVFDRLPSSVRSSDPLIDACLNLAWMTGRATVDGEALFHWMSPAFPDETAHERRLRRAACLLADLEWAEHPDYRVEHALLRILRYPMIGIDHAGRAYMGLAVASRHARVQPRLFDRFLEPLLEKKEARRARANGLAMRLGYTLSGGVISLLEQSHIRREGERLIFELPEAADVLVGDVVQRRFQSLAKLLGCKGHFSFVESKRKAAV